MRHVNKLIAALVACTIVMGAGAAIAQEQPPQEQPMAQLTDKQKQELAVLYKDVLSKHKEIIAKYVSFGVMTPDRAKMITAHLEKRYQLLEQNGFIPQWKHIKKHKHKH